jgi:ribosomal protein L12E/L44/L45/RPP1/RPP2
VVVVGTAMKAAPFVEYSAVAWLAVAVQDKEIEEVVVAVTVTASGAAAGAAALAVDVDTTDRNPAVSADTATTAMRCFIVFVDICFLSMISTEIVDD